MQANDRLYIRLYLYLIVRRETAGASPRPTSFAYSLLCHFKQDKKFSSQISPRARRALLGQNDGGCGKVGRNDGVFVIQKEVSADSLIPLFCYFILLIYDFKRCFCSYCFSTGVFRKVIRIITFNYVCACIKSDCLVR